MFCHDQSLGTQCLHKRLGGIPGFWLQIALALAAVATWGVNKQIEHLFLSLISVELLFQ